jgi:hypothetical protein
MRRLSAYPSKPDDAGTFAGVEALAESAVNSESDETASPTLTKILSSIRAHGGIAISSTPWAIT